MMLVTIVLLLVGSLASLVAAVGLLRFPNFYARVHAAALAGPLGAGLIILAAGTASGDLSVLIRCVLGIAFLLLGSPVAAHFLARAAFRADPPALSNASIAPDDDSC